MRRFIAIRAAVFFACLIPFLRLAFDAVTDNLGANPIEAITRFTGVWTLIFLLITLGVTPLRKTTGWYWLIKLRRMLGLFAFFYACLHFATYIVLDQFFAAEEILKDIAKRPYVTVGFVSFLLLIPLAITSTSTMIRRLGKHWQKLHRIVYPIAIGGVVHFLWLVKADIRRPSVYAGVLAVLLGYRLLGFTRVRLGARASGKSFLLFSR